MIENTTPKPSLLAKSKAVAEKYKTPILVTTLTASVALNVVQNRGIASLNAFLKEQNLFETFYAITPNEVI